MVGLFFLIQFFDMSRKIMLYIILSLLIIYYIYNLLIHFVLFHDLLSCFKKKTQVYLVLVFRDFKKKSQEVFF